jgi:hypothetical protein
MIYRKILLSDYIYTEQRAIKLSYTRDTDRDIYLFKVIEADMIYNMSWKRSDAVEMGVLLCVIPNVQEFLCPVWEIAILIEGRVNMNSAVEGTSLPYTRIAI